MTDIKTISRLELAIDLADSIADIALCELAIRKGQHEYNGKSVSERLKSNIRIRKIIETEIYRRGRELEWNPPLADEKK